MEQALALLLPKKVSDVLRIGWQAQHDRQADQHGEKEGLLELIAATARDVHRCRPVCLCVGVDNQAFSLNAQCRTRSFAVYR